jgi:hypothetical protein
MIFLMSLHHSNLPKKERAMRMKQNLTDDKFQVWLVQTGHDEGTTCGVCIFGMYQVLAFGLDYFTFVKSTCTISIGPLHPLVGKTKHLNPCEKKGLVKIFKTPFLEKGGPSSMKTVSKFCLSKDVLSIYRAMLRMLIFLG